MCVFVCGVGGRFRRLCDRDAEDKEGLASKFEKCMSVITGERTKLLGSSLLGVSKTTRFNKR